MVEVDEALKQWLEKVKRISDMPLAEQEKITSAGANVVADHLRQATAAKHHRSKGDGGKYGHLLDQIGVDKGNIDGEHDGTSVEGFHKKAFVARMLNDGTKKMQGDSFVDNAREDAKAEAFEAEAKAYREYVKKAGEDL